MPKLKDIAEKNGVTVEEAVRILSSLNFRDLSAQTEISDMTRFLVFDRALYNLNKSQAPRKKVEETRQTSEQSGKITPEEQQRQILSRDFILVTLTALRKPQLAELLDKIASYILTKSSNSVVILTSSAKDALVVSTLEHQELSANLQGLNSLSDLGAVRILPTKNASDEFSAMSDFISKAQPKDSISVIGTNRPLRTFISRRNYSLKQNPPKDGFCPIIECDISRKGGLTAPTAIRPVFDSAENTNLASFDEKTPLLASAKIPSTGSNVYIRILDDRGDFVKRPLKLDSLLFEGDESTVYSVGDGKLCAKIFRSKALTDMKVKKIELMCSKYAALKASDSAIFGRIAWPEQLVYSENDLPLGYLMKHFADTRPLSDYTVYEFEKLVPKLTKEHQITMALSLCEIFEFCHSNNVMVCDLKKSDLLYSADGKAYLCDTDSVQICDKGVRYTQSHEVPECLPPERISESTFSYERKNSDDVWTLQTLLFYILTPCGSPYAFVNHSDTEDVIFEPIKRGLYPFGSATVPCNELVQRRHTIWSNIISHLHYKLRDLFYDGFCGKGNCFFAENRLSSYDWLEAIDLYRRELPLMLERDSMSGEYIPTARRRYDDLPTDGADTELKITESYLPENFDAVSSVEKSKAPTARHPTRED